MRSSLVLLGLCVAGSAWAKGEKAGPADANHYADESTVWFEIMQGEDGYWVHAGAHAYGISKDDQFRLEVKQGSKLLESIGCGYSNDAILSGGHDLEVECGAHTDKNLKVAGALTADLILHSDKDDKEYVLRTFNVTAKKWDNQVWQIELDDVLGPGYVAAREHQSGSIQPEFRFWIANAVPASPTIRCKVDGKSLPEIAGSWQDRHTMTVDIIKGPKRTTWHWAQVILTGNNFYWDKGAIDKQSFGDHPGSWDCEVRFNGAMVRELKFVVDANGNVPAHPMQNAKGAPLLGPRVSQIDMVIGAGNGVDQRIKPDVLKKSRGFGLAWPQHDSVKALASALPAAFENQSPTAVKPKGSGKLIVGTTLNPPRFVDPSDAFVHIGRRSDGKTDGYEFFASQVAVNVPNQKSDRYRMEWKQGGKVLATAKCEWGYDQRDGGMSGDEHTTAVTCKYDEKPLTAKGAVEASLILSDDMDGNDYVLTTYKLNVAKFPSFGDAVWQILPDDVLATAYAAYNFEGSNAIAFRFWVATGKSMDLKMRCTVDGKKKVPDFKPSTVGGTIEAETHPRNGEGKKYVWTFINGRVTSPDVAPGLPEKGFKPSADQLQYLGEYPGAWDCDVRDEGKVIRKLLFKVNDKGLIEADPAQAGTLTRPGVVPIEMRWGKDMIDERIRPDAMKKSRGFGQPWAKAPTKPFPPASGLPDPK